MSQLKCISLRMYQWYILRWYQLFTANNVTINTPKLSIILNSDSKYMFVCVSVCARARACVVFCATVNIYQLFTFKVPTLIEIKMKTILLRNYFLKSVFIDRHCSLDIESIITDKDHLYGTWVIHKRHKLSTLLKLPIKASLRFICEHFAAERLEYVTSSGCWWSFSLGGVNFFFTHA